MVCVLIQRRLGHGLKRNASSRALVVSRGVLSPPPAGKPWGVSSARALLLLLVLALLLDIGTR